MKNRFCWLGIFMSMCLVISGCDDIAAVQTPSLIIEPERLVFPKPADGEDVSTLAITLTNDGAGPLIIRRIYLTEDDELSELTLLDRDDWQSVVTLRPGEFKRAQVSWRVRDALGDVGRLTIEHNAGPDVVVPLETPDIDPRLAVSSDPEGVIGDAEIAVTLDEAMSGQTQRTVIRLESQSVAVLEINNICLLGGNGACLDELTDETGLFRFCAGTPISFEDCEAPAVAAALRNGEAYEFTAFFSPDSAQAGQRVGQILIESNASVTPQFVVKLVGKLCVRVEASDVCGSCGDGEVQAGESCDDGNADDGDDCSNACTQYRCGDGIVQAGLETCDDGNDIDTDECLNRCTRASCGDGVVQDGVEACDDGNELDTDACLNSCTIARCGDALTQTDVEQCDDGNDIDTDGCLTNCQSARCGDGVVLNFFEDCDDGNQDDSDDCLTTCQQARCGDGFVRSGVEACDDGNTMTEACLPGQEGCMVCDAQCQTVPGAVSICGDGDVQPPEACDDGNVITEVCEYGQIGCEVCADDCTLEAGLTSFCGDEIPDPDNGEQCDDGNELMDDGCDRCRVSACGDGRVTPPEQCDDSNAITETCAYGELQCAVCNAECRLSVGETAFCGDEIINGPEVCDGGPDCDDECSIERLVRGDLLYGDACDCGADCQSGFCLRNPHNNGLGQCTQTCVGAAACPGIDRCVQSGFLPRDPDCADPGLPYDVGEIVEICAPNETGVVCTDGADCFIDGICLNPPNPVPAQVQVPAECAARCERDNQCPTGYRCEAVRNQAGQLIRVCAADVEIVGCAGGQFELCGGICQPNAGENQIDIVACIQPMGGPDGYCSCLCATSADCPRGFGCDRRLASGNPRRPFACVPVSGYICPEGDQNVCLSESCLFDPDTGLNQCTSACLADVDCPQGFRCTPVPGSPFNYCLP